MSTRSLIGRVQEDGSVQYVYCHSDGYVGYNGVYLNGYWNTDRKVASLISKGGISSLGKKLGKKHPFDLPRYKMEDEKQRDWTRLYHRDRGEELEIQVVADEAAFLEANHWTEYWYLWKDGAWWVCDGSDGTSRSRDAYTMPKLIKVSEAMLHHYVVLSATGSEGSDLTVYCGLEPYAPDPERRGAPLTYSRLLDLVKEHAPKTRIEPRRLFVPLAAAQALSRAVYIENFREHFDKATAPALFEVTDPASVLQLP